MTPYTTKVSYSANGTQTDFQIPFQFLSKDTIYVYANKVLKTYGTDYIILDSGYVQFLSAPTSGILIDIQRHTPLAVEDKVVNFTDGSSFTADDLNNNTNELLFALQELIEMSGSFDLLSTSAVNTSIPLVTDNLNDISNLAKPKNGRKTFCIYVKNDIIRSYVWNATSTLTADGVNVISASVGGTGRWISSASINKNQTYFCKTTDELRALRTAELKLTSDFTCIYAIVFSSSSLKVYKYTNASGIDDGDTVIVPTENIGSWLKDTTFTGSGGSGESTSQEIYIPATAFFVNPASSTDTKVEVILRGSDYVQVATVPVNQIIDAQIKQPIDWTVGSVKVTLHFLTTNSSIAYTITLKHFTGTNILTKTATTTISGSSNTHSTSEINSLQNTYTDKFVINTRGFITLSFTPTLGQVRLLGITLELL